MNSLPLSKHCDILWYRTKGTKLFKAVFHYTAGVSKINPAVLFTKAYLTNNETSSELYVCTLPNNALH